MSITIRTAVAADIPSIRALQERSMRELGGKHYTPDELALFIARFGTMDFGVVEEGHFFVAMDADGIACGTGGWSRRRPGYQSGRRAEEPAQAATVRGVFVDPTAARRGIGSALMRHIESDAAAHGIATLKLTATLSGEALYATLGYREIARRAIDLPGGRGFGCVDMEKALAVDNRTAAA